MTKGKFPGEHHWIGKTNQIKQAKKVCQLEGKKKKKKQVNNIISLLVTLSFFHHNLSKKRYLL